MLDEPDEVEVIEKPIKLMIVGGARPNWMKISPILRAIDQYNLNGVTVLGPGDYGLGTEAITGLQKIKPIIVNTGQHYDYEMAGSFLEGFGISEDDMISLDVRKNGLGMVMATVMARISPVMEYVEPDAVMVVGDVDSTLAAAITARRLSIPVIHVEAGLRSDDETMPEENNRRLTDHVSDLLFTTESDADHNLDCDGIDMERVHFVGDVMIDCLMQHEEEIAASDIVSKLGLEGKPYAVLTLHRPANVDDGEILRRILDAVEEISKKIPIIFPIHPRTKNALLGCWGDLPSLRGPLQAIKPQPYADFMSLVKNSRMVLTDSGGIQSETTFFGVPCLTLRENTERPITMRMGSNALAGTATDEIVNRAMLVLEDGWINESDVPPQWDGFAAERIVEHIALWWRDRIQV